MREAIKVFARFFSKLKGYLISNVIFNTLGAIFGIFSFVAIIPLLKLIFKRDFEVYEKVDIDISIIPWNFPTADIKNNAYAAISNMIQDKDPQHALMIVGAIGVLMVFLKSGFNFAGSFTMIKILNHTVKDLRGLIYKKVLTLPIGFFNEERKGDILARATTDIKEVETSIQSSVDMLFKNPIIIFFTILFMLFMSWQLTLFVFIMFPIAGGIIGYIGKTLRGRSLKGQNKIGEILSTIEETLGGLRIIKAFNAEKKMYAKQNNENEEYRHIMDGLMARNSLASPLSEFLGTIIIVILMWYGGNLILNENSSLDSEEFLGYLILFYNIINPSKNFSISYYRIQKGLASLDRIDEVLNTESNIIIKEDAEPISSFNSNIEYSGVWFKYIDDYVLSDINIKVDKGQTIALVGQSGSGKSTMIDLIPRFYDVKKGSIKVDGKDIRDLDLIDLRKLMGIVNQEPILFNDTIYNNIAFGVDSTTQEEVEQAARIANAHEFIMETEDGYQTNIGDRGNRLSGGQRQRISIARAILTNPPIMILDEATSALDTESERLVQDAINKLMKNRTSIVIAHRLSTIRNADMIYVLKYGKVIESGNYDELLKQDGEFKKLHDIQFG